MSEGAGRFVELVIAATIGSIVGAFIARDIELNLDLFIRAVFATAVLAVFFFLLWKMSGKIGQKKNTGHSRISRIPRYRKHVEENSEIEEADESRELEESDEAYNEEYPEDGFEEEEEKRK